MIFIEFFQKIDQYNVKQLNYSINWLYIQVKNCVNVAYFNILNNTSQ